MYGMYVAQGSNNCTRGGRLHLSHNVANLPTWEGEPTVTQWGNRQVMWGKCGGRQVVGRVCKVVCGGVGAQWGKVGRACSGTPGKVSSVG